MERENTTELLDDPALPADEVARAYRDLDRTHRWLGNNAAVIARLRKAQAKSVLDLGCGQGALLEEIRRKLGIETAGIDVRPAPDNSGFQIYALDAVRDSLPSADSATAVCLVHHLTE